MTKIKVRENQKFPKNEFSTNDFVMFEKKNTAFALMCRRAGRWLKNVSTPPRRGPLQSSHCHASLPLPPH